jgi:hypothetical protein
MNAEQVKQAVLRGETVCWANTAYEVRHNEGAGFYIIYTPTGNSVGLHEPSYFPNEVNTDFFVNNR